VHKKRVHWFFLSFVLTRTVLCLGLAKISMMMMIMIMIMTTTLIMRFRRTVILAGARLLRNVLDRGRVRVNSNGL